MAFQKGKSGNPGGRPKEQAFRNALTTALAADGDQRKKLRQIADKLVASAVAGEQWAIKEVADRLDGKPAQAVMVGSDPENPIEQPSINALEHLYSAIARLTARGEAEGASEGAGPNGADAPST